MTSGMATGATNLFQEREESLSVEAIFFPAKNKLPVPDSYGAKIASPLSGRVMQNNRILHFRRNPHPAGRTVLLEPDLIHRPKVKAGIFGQIMKFFYMSPIVPDLHGPSAGKVCETGNQGSEIGAGIVGRPRKHHMTAG